MSRLISRVTILITLIRGLITLLITTPNPTPKPLNPKAYRTLKGTLNPYNLQVSRPTQKRPSPRSPGLPGSVAMSRRPVAAAFVPSTTMQYRVASDRYTILGVPLQGSIRVAIRDV